MFAYRTQHKGFNPFWLFAKKGIVWSITAYLKSWQEGILRRVGRQQVAPVRAIKYFAAQDAAKL